ncbi:S-layer homology domain-containing protein [Chengkuizengella axinellae]|uniref:S-layer homology domain-containing protein n=1 Tax=Chengkuizengella axinellae TaxID=3064388 RepID=A0ABT9J8L8_9BACL|nr:S-layer homology domain-containing protein [Chengkuizengella sp. 2205SS18-9]MDP5277259.1 S-layer homology domain-containing protein [Chengkuizengella sp. 2205SS18-9]
MLKKPLVVILSLMLLLPSTSVFAVGGQPSAWSKETIQRGIDLGIVPERLQANYADPITREEFAELLVNVAFKKLELVERSHEWTKEMVLEKVTIDQSFEDTDLDHVKLAYIIGSVNGTSDTTFSPDAFITREQAAQMLMNTIHKASIVSYATEEEMGYWDYDQIGEWAIPAVSAAYNLELMKGSNGQFMPRKHITREQAIVTIIRVLDHAKYITLQLRGDITAYAWFDDLTYNVGKDYVNVSYEDEGEFSLSDQALREMWFQYSDTYDSGVRYDHEKAIVIYGFHSNLLSLTYTWILDSALKGEGAKVDYGYMTVETFTENHLLEFKLKDIPGYFNALVGHVYGYPKVEVDPNPID